MHKNQKQKLMFITGHLIISVITKISIFVEAQKKTELKKLCLAKMEPKPSKG